MKTEGEVHHKLQQVRFRHLKKELEARLAQDPANCRNWTNLSMCQLQNIPCSRKPNNALTCGVFELANDKDALKNEMKEFFRTRPAAEIAVRFPDVAALMWVLDGSVPAEVFLEEFREEELKANLAKAEALLEERAAALEEATSALTASKDENVRLKAALYDDEALSFTAITTGLKDQERDRSLLLQGYVEEVAKLRNQCAVIEPPTPWYLALYRRIFK